MGDKNFILEFGSLGPALFYLLYSDNVTLKGHFHSIALFFLQRVSPLLIFSQRCVQIQLQLLTFKPHPKDLNFFSFPPRKVHCFMPAETL